MSLQKVLQDYLHYIRAVDQKPLAAVRFYAQDLQECLSQLQIQGETEMEDILPWDIQSFLSDMEQGSIQEGGLCYKRSSVNHMLSSIHMFHRSVSMNHSSILDPSIHLRGGKKEQRLPLYFNPHDTESLPDSFRQDAQGLYQKATLELPYGYGLRVSEVCKLRINQVYLEQSYLQVTGKEDKERTVPTHEHYMRIPRTYLTQTHPTWEKRKNIRVFLSNRGSVLTRQYVRALIKQRLRAPGLDEHLSTHSFRHSLVTHLLDDGADLQVAQELLGHSSVITIQIYTHVQNRRLKKAIDQYHPRSAKKEE